MTESIQAVKKWAGNAAIANAGINTENDEFYGEINAHLPSHYPSFFCLADLQLRIYKQNRIEYRILLPIDEELHLTIEGSTDGKTMRDTLNCIEKKLIEINKSVSIVLGGLINNLEREVFPE